MIAHALDNSRSAGIPDAEALAAPSIRKERAARGSIHDGIAKDDAIVRLVFSLGDGLDHDLAAAHALADIVVGLSVRINRTPGARKVPKLCPELPLKRSSIVPSGRPSSPY